MVEHFPASKPLAVLKSLLRREILLLSWGRRLLVFSGFVPNTMRDVLWEGVSGLQLEVDHGVPQIL